GLHGGSDERGFIVLVLYLYISARYTDSAGGYWYQQNAQLGSVTRNRFIHWATSGGTLELMEESLDINLLSNAIQLKFQNCSLLPGGVHIFETQNHVVILILTNQTVHRLILPHPARMYRSELISESHMQSVFTDIGKVHFRDPLNYCVIPTVPGLSVHSSASAAWLSSDGGALFALPSATGGIFVLQLPSYDVHGMTSPSVLELKQSSVMQRLLTGWMPTAIRGDQGPSDLPVSMSVHCREHDTLLFALYQDHKLRMWSYKDQICLMVADMLEFVPVNKDLRLAAGTGHKLQLSYSETLGLYIGVYLHAPKQGQFCVFQLVSTESHRYSLDHISSLFTSQETLIDFTLTTSEIWALWHDDENQTTVKYINFEQNVAGQWNQVSMQPLPSEEVDIRDNQHPRIYSQGTERLTDLSWDELKKQITTTVENEFQGNVAEYEFSHEEFRQLQVESWSKFYAYCLQYQEELSRPLALLWNQCSNMVCLLKKGQLSFLVPCSLMDHLYLLPDEQLINEVEKSEFTHDLVSLVQCLRLIGESVTVEMTLKMEMACFCRQSPERAAEQILKDLIANDTENLMEDIHSKLQEIKNPIGAIGVLIREMDYETDMEMERGFNIVQPLNVRMHLSQLYGSSTTVNMVCRCVCKMSMTRFFICRDLLILQQLLLRLGDAVSMPRGDCLSSRNFILRESNLQHLSVLKLTDSSALAPLKLVSSPQTIVELFFQEVARKHTISQLFQSDAALDEAGLNWPQMFSAICSYLLQFLWPSNPCFLFPECLMGACQYTQLQEYIRLLEPWCHVNVGSCRFLMGHCHLVMGEGHKALDCFCQAASEVGKEEFLDRLIRSEDVEMTSTPRLQYYDKVLRLLDTMGLPELIIQLATLAITEATDDWRSQATLRTCIFKHHLDLGHNSQAYEALIHNPDSNYCIRPEFLKLCSSRCFGLRFPQFLTAGIAILNVWFLFFLPIAGTVMFEYEMRLGREVRTLAGLQKQPNCYLAALNCLRLIRPEYAWIVQPASGAVYERPGGSPKRSHDGECTVAPMGSQIEILELQDLERECMLARIRLTLAQHDPSTTAITGNSSPKELVTLLVQAGLFDTAISLCQTYNISLKPVFEGLTFKCVKLQFGGEAALTEAWDWLAANQFSSVITTKETRYVIYFV
uniref:Nucleoporin 160 n=1 Tax=Anolis carolinensis TaxID=28377 RepID=A0A803T0I3_ANOCA